MATCVADGCGRTGQLTRGYCHKHYGQALRSGALQRIRIKDPINRFWSYVEHSDDCWIWTGAKSAAGYGRIEWNRRQQQAHRVAYELIVGPIPEGLELDHLCRNRACVRPDHLEPVTGRINLLRGNTYTAYYAHRTHCEHGHLLTEGNVYLWRGTRYCRMCRARTSANRDRSKYRVGTVQAECVMCGTAFSFVRGPGGRASNVCSDECRKGRRRKAAREHQRRKRAAT